MERNLCALFFIKHIRPERSRTLLFLCGIVEGRVQNHFYMRVGFSQLLRVSVVNCLFTSHFSLLPLHPVNLRGIRNLLHLRQAHGNLLARDLELPHLFNLTFKERQTWRVAQE